MRKKKNNNKFTKIRKYHIYAYIDTNELEVLPAGKAKMHKSQQPLVLPTLHFAFDFPL